MGHIQFDNELLDMMRTQFLLGSFKCFLLDIVHVVKSTCALLFGEPFTKYHRHSILKYRLINQEAFGHSGQHDSRHIYAWLGLRAKAMWDLPRVINLNRMDAFRVQCSGVWNYKTIWIRQFWPIYLHQSCWFYTYRFESAMKSHAYHIFTWFNLISVCLSYVHMGLGLLTQNYAKFHIG